MASRLPIVLTGRKSHPIVVWGLCAAVTVLLAGIDSPYVWVSLLLDGTPAVMIILSAFGLGLHLVPLLRMHDLPLRWQFLMAFGAGVGAISLLVQGLGLLGLLHRLLWLILLIVFLAGGVLRIAQLIRQHRALNPGESGSAARPSGMQRYLWWLACPFIALALRAASTPPGLIWKEEGYGYDVLEYHLQLPKEYYQQGRILYLPHNVYGSFPANVEMLYLLGMIVVDETVDAGIAANMIHLCLGLLAVFSAWVVGCDGSASCGRIAALLTVCNGWFVYLSGLAYVENGLLFFGIVAIGAALRATMDTKDSQRWCAISGIAVGLACGCKYTALIFLAVPIAVSLIGATCAGRFRVSGLALFCLATLAAFSPWLLKNQLMTRNPVFPLLNTWFDAHPPGCGVAQTEQWDRAHDAQSGRTRATFIARCQTAWQHIFADRQQRFGPLIFLFALLGALMHRAAPTTWALLAVLCIQVAAWLTLTHLFARFATVLLIPLSLLGGQLGRRPFAMKDALAATQPPDQGLRPLIYAFLIIGWLWNLCFAYGLHATENVVPGPSSVVYLSDVPGLDHYGFVNTKLPGDARILLVGDARAFYYQRRADYCVVFNRNPFVEYVQSATNDRAVVQWLVDQGYTHLLVHWSEIRRLRSTYGFAPEVTEALFERLQQAGLVLLKEFRHPDIAARYISIYGLPPRGSRSQ